MAGFSSTEENSMQYYSYPPAIASYEDVIADQKLFMDTLSNFHAAMGTKFMIPILGGKDLDLYRLFVEVTSRGGIKRVLGEKKWREVTNSFNFPPSITNASFVLRKYYMSLIHHFEQVYYFKAKGWTPVSTVASEPSSGFRASGIIDGKFENGYLCTVMIGGEKLHGILFQSTAHSSYQPT